MLLLGSKDFKRTEMRTNSLTRRSNTYLIESSNNVDTSAITGPLSSQNHGLKLQNRFLLLFLFFKQSKMDCNPCSTISGGGDVKGFSRTSRLVKLGKLRSSVGK